MARLEQFENMERFPFMALPPELRLMVYDFALEDIKKYTEPRAHLNMIRNFRRWLIVKVVELQEGARQMGNIALRNKTER